jgi:putative salt-induced outer membrane protein YdiY
MRRLLVLSLALCAVALPATAQVARPSPPVVLAKPRPPDQPPPGWDAAIGAGLAVTSGNSDTSTLNLKYDLLRDAGGVVVLKSMGVYLRGESDGVTNVDRAAAEARMDVRLTPRLSALGQVGYFRDRFKDIAYLVSPTGGLSVALVTGRRVDLALDGSVGFAFEKNTGRGRDTDGAMLGGQTLAVRLSDTARVTQGLSGLWKMDDRADALYILSVGLTSSIVRRTELKVELLDTYKNRPIDPTSRRNDVSFLVSVVYKVF